MDFITYPKPYNHAHSLHVYFWHNLGTMYSNTYPELYKLAHSLLVYLLHNLGTIHTIWVFLDWMLSQSAWYSAIHDVIVFNFFFNFFYSGEGQAPSPDLVEMFNCNWYILRLQLKRHAYTMQWKHQKSNFCYKSIYEIMSFTEYHNTY